MDAMSGAIGHRSRLCILVVLLMYASCTSHSQDISATLPACSPRQSGKSSTGNGVCQSFDHYVFDDIWPRKYTFIVREPVYYIHVHTYTYSCIHHAHARVCVRGVCIGNADTRILCVCARPIHTRHTPRTHHACVSVVYARIFIGNAHTHSMC